MERKFVARPEVENVMHALDELCEDGPGLSQDETAALVMNILVNTDIDVPADKVAKSVLDAATAARDELSYMDYDVIGEIEKLILERQK